MNGERNKIFSFQITGPAEYGTEEIMHILVAFSLENDRSLGYRKHSVGG
jgi:hypothetical protein